MLIDLFFLELIKKPSHACLMLQIEETKKQMRVHVRLRCATSKSIYEVIVFPTWLRFL